MRLRGLAIVTVLLSIGCAVGTASAMTASPSAMGHDQGNGADYSAPEDGAAWFVGKSQPVKFCVRVAPQFGKSKLELDKLVKATFERWTDYMHEKNVSTFEPPERIVALKDCDGTQDIRFMFGVADQEVNSHLGKFENPVSITVRTSFDNNRGKGFVWIAAPGSVDTEIPQAPFPDWSLKGNLEIILLHELGHIYGVPHVEGTIMDEGITRFLSRVENTGDDGKFNSIDIFSELAICFHCNISKAGALGTYQEIVSMHPDGSTEKTVFDTRPENFRMLTGRNSSGEISALVSGSSSKGYSLLVQDDVGKFEYKINLFPGSHSTVIGQPIFRFFERTSGGNGATRFINHEASSDFGSITLSSGTTLTVSMQRNFVVPIYEDQGMKFVGPSRLAITSQDSAGSRVIFNANYNTVAPSVKAPKSPVK